MKCKEARKRIYPLLDDELETETNIEVLAHLNVCDRCQEKFEAERNFLNDLSAGLTDQAVPEDVQQDIRDRLEAERTKRTVRSPSTSGTRWRNIVSAAVFLLLVVTAGLLTNYFPLHRGTASGEVVHTFPDYHDEVVERNKETYKKQVESGTFKTFSEIKANLSAQFPEFGTDLQIPSLEENQCKVLDVGTLPSEKSSFNAPNFHVMYCYVGDKVRQGKSHEGVMMVGLEQTDVDLDRVSDLQQVKGADGLYINTDQEGVTHCVFWKNDRFLMALITDGLERDHLVELARSARNDMEKVRSTSSSRD